MLNEIPALITQLAANAPGFQARLAQAGLSPRDLHTMEDLNGLPVLRKDQLITLQAADPPFGGMLACAPGELNRIFQSPGPIYDPEARRPDYWRWAPALQAAGFSPGDLVLNAFSYHLTPAGAMFEEGLRAIGCAVIPAGVGNQEQQVIALNDLKVPGYVGLPSYLKALLDKAADLEFSLRLSKAFVTAEPLPDSLRKHLNDLGITVRQGYGTAECGNLGYECAHEDGWHVPENAVIQVCDLNTGQPLDWEETGEIVVTLLNPEYALVRFGTGDLSALNPHPCPCGLPSPRLMGWQGRVDQARKVRGMFLHPHQLHSLMSRFPDVTRWQAVIARRHHKDFLTLKLVLGVETDEAHLVSDVVQAARDTIKIKPEVEFVTSEELPEGSSSYTDTRSWE